MCVKETLFLRILFILRTQCTDIRCRHKREYYFQSFIYPFREISRPQEIQYKRYREIRRTKEQLARYTPILSAVFQLFDIFSDTNIKGIIDIPTCVFRVTSGDCVEPLIRGDEFGIVVTVILNVSLCIPFVYLL